MEGCALPRAWDVHSEGAALPSRGARLPYPCVSIYLHFPYYTTMSDRCRGGKKKTHALKLVIWVPKLITGMLKITIITTTFFFSMNPAGLCPIHSVRRCMKLLLYTLPVLHHTQHLNRWLLMARWLLLFPIRILLFFNTTWYNMASCFTFIGMRVTGSKFS